MSTSPGPALHVVLTCTKRKRRAAGAGLQLHSHAAPSLDARFEAWLQALQEPVDAGSSVPVRDLYAGDHWQVGTSLPALAEAQGSPARLWVCSAGYGLLPLDARIAPYSATFSRGHRDSVWRPGEEHTHPEAVHRWWSRLGDWAGPVPGAPRSLRALAARDPGARIWVVASPTYLQAMRSDLVETAGALDRRDSLVLISAGTRRLAGLDESLLRFDWRLQGAGGVLSGAAMSLNVRVAKLLLAGGGSFSATDLNRRLRTLMREIPPKRPKRRERVSREQVEAFVRSELRADPAARATPLLRKLRGGLGWAFEEKRFRGLVDAVRAEAVPDQERTRKYRDQDPVLE